jgi:hypothetical protein
MFTNTPTNFNSPASNGSSGQLLQSQGVTLPIYVSLPNPSTFGTSGQVLQSLGNSIIPTWTTANLTAVAPTVQKFTATGATTGAVFQITTGASAALNAVYGNNGATYLVSAAFSGVTFLFTSGTNFAAALSGATLQLLSGTGSSGIGFTLPVTLATYTTPVSTPLYIKIVMAGGGGGGGPGSSSGTNGANGGPSFFGTNSILALGGGGGAFNGGPAVGGAAVLGSIAIGLALSGGYGQSDTSAGPSGTSSAGGAGGSNPLGGAGGNGYNNGPGTAGATNSGAGGGGGGGTISNPAGGGGGAGGFVYGVITSVSPTYSYAVGTGGAAGSGGTNGGAGAAGVVVVEEHYQ